MNSIYTNGTWDLIELLKNRKALPCLWVYPPKQTADFPRPKYKALIVAKGFRQEYGVNFDEVFSPVFKMTTLCFLHGVVAAENLELHQLDCKMALLPVIWTRKFTWSSRKASHHRPRTSSLLTMEEPLRTKAGSTAMVPEV